MNFRCSGFADISGRSVGPACRCAGWVAPFSRPENGRETGAKCGGGVRNGAHFPGRKSWPVFGPVFRFSAVAIAVSGDVVLTFSSVGCGGPGVGRGGRGARVGRGRPHRGGRQLGLRRGGAAGVGESIALLCSRVSLAAALRVAVACGFVVVGGRSVSEAVLADGLAQKGSLAREGGPGWAKS